MIILLFLWVNLYNTKYLKNKQVFNFFLVQIHVWRTRGLLNRLQTSLSGFVFEFWTRSWHDYTFIPKWKTSLRFPLTDLNYFVVEHSRFILPAKFSWMNRRERILFLEILECKTSLVFGKLLLYLEGLRKVTLRGNALKFAYTIYMHIDIKVIFDPSTLSYMENETKKE